MTLSDAELLQRRVEAFECTLTGFGDSVSLLAHEIKNPKAAVHLALRAVASKLGEEEEAVLQDLVDRLDHLEQRLRRALSLAAPLELEPAECDVSALLRAVAPEGAAVVAADGLTLQIDRPRLEEALEALLDNASRAASGRGRVTVLARAKEGGVRIEVDDDGPGVPEELREVAFQPFFTTEHGRSGLGLAVARRIVGAHGGTIGLDEAPGGGTRAWVELNDPCP